MQLIARIPSRVASSTRITLRPTTIRRQLSSAVMASKDPIFEIAVKGDQETGILGDCPFSHRALLTLEEKHVPYKMVFVDLDNKPQWLFDVNPSGTVPVLKELSTGVWTPDSGVIANMMEERFPEPKLGTAEGSPQVGNNIFPAFKEFAKSSDEDKAVKESALLAALDELEDYLKKNGGPYVGGTDPCATDISLMPKLHQMVIALDHFRGWQMPAKYTAIRTMMDNYMARDAWKNTYYSRELVIKGWIRHGLQVKK